MSDSFGGWLSEPLGGSLVTNNSGKTAPRVNGKPQPRKSAALHNYRLNDPSDLRGVPATNGAQADDPRKRHKLAAIRKPRTHAIALTDTLVTRADGSQYWIKRTARSVSRKETQRRTLDTIDLQNRLDEHKVRTARDLDPIQNYGEDN